MSMLADLTSGMVSDGLQSILNNTIFRLVYYIAAAVCWVIGILYDLFEVMAGLVKVTYDGEKQYLINIFFGNSSVSKAYWGMAMIGFALCFAFTIIAVIRKMMDLEGKVQATLGVIIGNCVRSIAIIALMSAFMLAMLNMTNVLIQQVMYIFNNAENLGKDETITYTDEEYAAMARVLNTIGNYSLNPAWTSRYNINSCFNDFREDLQWLYDQGVFDTYYDDDIIKHTSWQSELEKIVYTVDLTADLPLNTYNENLQAALEHTVEVMQTDKKFKPISSYTRTSVAGSETVPLDRILFLSCTMRAANNSAFNISPSFTDALRGPYYTGVKSIYDFDTVASDFNVGLATDYILLFIVGYAMIKDLFEIIFTCVSRIFNMILLYLVSPPLIAAAPLDGGGKLKQWITAMIVQSFGVFGTIVAMRIMMLLVPIMMSAELVLFDNVLLNIFGKIILIVGALEVEKKAVGLITGILSDNAGYQAVNAGDMKETSGKFMHDMKDFGWGTAKGVAKTGFYGGKGLFYGGKGLYQGGKYVGNKMMDGGRMAGNALGRAAVSGASWVGNKMSGMFSRDQGAPERDNTNPYEGTELQDLSAAGSNPQKAMNGAQSEQKEQQQNQKSPVQQSAPQKAMNGAQPEKKEQQQNQKSQVQQSSPKKVQQSSAPQQPLSPQQQAKNNMDAGLDPLGGGVKVKAYKPAETPPKTQALSPQQQVQNNMDAGLDPLGGVKPKAYKPAKTPPKTPPKTPSVQQPSASQQSPSSQQQVVKNMNAGSLKNDK